LIDAGDAGHRQIQQRISDVVALALQAGNVFQLALDGVQRGLQLRDFDAAIIVRHHTRQSHRRTRRGVE
jgi:hypothetical protein